MLYRVVMLRGMVMVHLKRVKKACEQRASNNWQPRHSANFLSVKMIRSELKGVQKGPVKTRGRWQHVRPHIVCLVDITDPVGGSPSSNPFHVPGEQRVQKVGPEKEFFDARC